MANFFRLLANSLHRYRQLIAICCVMVGASLAYLLLFASIELQQQYMLVNLLGLLWSLMFYLLIVSFYQPEVINAPQGFFTRFKQKVIGVIAAIYLVIFALLLAATFYFTVRVLAI